MLQKKQFLVGKIVQPKELCFQRSMEVFVPRTAGRKKQFFATQDTQRGKTDQVVLSVQCCSLGVLGLTCDHSINRERHPGRDVRLKNNLPRVFLT